MTVPHTVKITDIVSNVTMYNVVTQCKTCKGDMVVPEIFASWYRRTFADDPEHIKVSCKDCGGQVIDPFMWHSAAWREGVEEKPPVTAPKSVHVPTIELEDDDLTPLSNYYYGTNTDKSFWSAHSKLKAFIVCKEDSNARDTKPVEPSVHDGPEVHEAG